MLGFLLVAVAWASAAADDFEPHALPPYGIAAEHLQAVLQATGRGKAFPENAEFHGLRTLFFGGSYDFRCAAARAIDPDWQALCDELAEAREGRRATAQDVVHWAVNVSPGDDAAACRHKLRAYFERRAAKQPFTVRGKVTAEKSGAPLAGAFVRGASTAGAFADAQGRYAIVTLSTHAGQLHLGAFAEGKYRSLLFRGKADAADETVDFALVDEVPLHGRVFAPTGGRGAPFAVVECYCVDGTNRLGYAAATADAKGRFLLRGARPANTRTFSLRAFGFEPVAGAATAYAGSGTEDDPVELQMTEQRLLEGRVVDENGRPAPHARIEYVPLDSNRFNQSPLLAWTDVRGRFRLAAPPESGNSSRTMAVHGSGFVSARVPLPPPGQEARIELGRAGGFLEGTIRLPNGEPAGNCLLSSVMEVGAQPPDSLLHFGAATATDAKGKFRLGPLPAGKSFSFAAQQGNARKRLKAVVGEPGDFQLPAERIEVADDDL